MAQHDDFPFDACPCVLGLCVAMGQSATASATFLSGPTVLAVFVTVFARTPRAR